MKNKLLAITATSVFALSISVQADFFGSDHNWNNPMSTMIDAAKDVVTDTVDVVQDAVQTTVDKATDVVNSVAESAEVASLRGTHALDDLSLEPPKGKWLKNIDFDRNFSDQPPLIPHKSKGMKITLKKNRCLSCHSNENWREEDAVKMTASHFMNRSGKRLKTVSPRRYFCTQCHVPQINNKPLIGSDYTNTDDD